MDSPLWIRREHTLSVTDNSRGRVDDDTNAITYVRFRTINYYLSWVPNSGAQSAAKWTFEAGDYKLALWARLTDLTDLTDLVVPLAGPP
jgi:hypothetical protein